MAYEEIFTALADPTRRGIFEALRAGPCSVAEIAARQPVSRPAVSQHLRVLEVAGLVHGEARGTRRYYSVRSDALDDLRRYVDGFWDDVLSAFAEEIDKNPGDNHE